MKWVERYAGTPFTREQVDQLGILLGLPGHDAARLAASRISGLLYVFTYFEQRRLAVPNTKSAKRRLERIAAISGQLAHLLEIEPLADDLLRGPNSFESRQAEDGGIYMSQLLQEDRDRFQALIETLRAVRSNADFALRDEENFRRAYSLPPVDQAGRSAFARLLWPMLLNLWWEVGKRPAVTVNGPLHRFIALVHSAIGAPEPPGSTLKDAVLQWRQDDRMAWAASNPPWRPEDED